MTYRIVSMFGVKECRHAEKYLDNIGTMQLGEGGHNLTLENTICSDESYLNNDWMHNNIMLNTARQ